MRDKRIAKAVQQCRNEVPQQMMIPVDEIPL